MSLTTHLYLVLWLIISNTIFSLPQYAFVVCRGKAVQFSMSVVSQQLKYWQLWLCCSYHSNILLRGTSWQWRSARKKVCCAVQGGAKGLGRFKKQDMAGWYVSFMQWSLVQFY